MNRKDIRTLDKKRLAALFDFAESESETDGQAADAPSVTSQEDCGLEDTDSPGALAASVEDPPPSMGATSRDDPEEAPD